MGSPRKLQDWGGEKPSPLESSGASAGMDRMTSRARMLGSNSPGTTALDAAL
jgi:hypothetical protein